MKEAMARTHHGHVADIAHALSRPAFPTLGEHERACPIGPPECMNDQVRMKVCRSDHDTAREIAVPIDEHERTRQSTGGWPM